MDDDPDAARAILADLARKLAEQPELTDAPFALTAETVHEPRPAQPALFQDDEP